jgi:predicted transcriptional regulator
MKVGDICKREVTVIEKKESLLKAGRRMRESHLGSLIVVEKEGDPSIPMGILTDRDILMQVLTEGVPLEKISVEDIMTTDLVTAKENDSIYDTVQKMRQRGIRRIPVVDSRRNLIGILTADDLLEILSKEIRHLSEVFIQEMENEAIHRP